MKDRLILALDVDSLEEAHQFVRLLKKDVSLYKVGSALFTAAGPSAVKMIHDEGGRVFLDLKFHDIPNTVAKSCEAASRLGVFMLNVHASGGPEMLRAAAAAVKKSKSLPLLIGVTVLTSDASAGKVSSEVVRLAVLSQESGLSGVVCSAQEAEAVRKKCGKDFVIVTPGIRPTGFPKGDQRRDATPSEAIQNGADYIVVGRPILEARDPITAAREILHKIATD